MSWRRSAVTTFASPVRGGNVDGDETDLDARARRGGDGERARHAVRMGRGAALCGVLLASPLFLPAAERRHAAAPFLLGAAGALVALLTQPRPAGE
jgi:hypothetical protein